MENEMDRTCSMHRNAYKILIRNLQGRNPHRRLRCKGKDNIMMGLEKIGCRCVDRIYPTEDGVQRKANVNMV
jgi:hypothetical protein